MTTTIVGFDMGIRNLAYCVVTHDLSGFRIVKWDNVDLLEAGASAQTARSCTCCGNKSLAWCDLSGGKYCKACATGVRKKKTVVLVAPHPVLPCGPGAKALKALAVEKGLEGAKKMKKEELVSWAAKNYLMPYKATKTMDVGMDVILTAMDLWLTSVLPTFRLASLIRLENQPAMKIPTMKSVQIMLYTLLVHRLRAEYAWTGRVAFVHAGVKSRGATVAADATEGEAYTARKKDAVESTLEVLGKQGELGTPWVTFLESRSKKSDLADAFLMASRRDE